MWRSGGVKLGEGAELLVDDLAPGRHTIVLEVSDATAGDTRTLELEVKATEDDEGAMSTGLVVALVVVIVAVVLAHAPWNRSRG